MKKIVFFVSFVLCVCLFALPAFAIEYIEFIDSVTYDTYATYYVNDSYQVTDEFVPYPDSHSGYEFIGWSYYSDEYYYAGFSSGDELFLEFSYDDDNVTYWAYYDVTSQEVSYINFYDGVNGNHIAALAANDGGMVDIFPTPPSKPGLTFAGWYDNIDGEGDPYTDYQFDDYYGGYVELFALYTVQWQKILPFSSGSSSGSVFYGTPKRDVFGTPYEPEGYTFLHWSTSSNGVAYSVNGLLTQSLTLYAVYRYDGGTGTDPVEPPPYNPPSTEPYEPNLDRETVLMLGDTLWQGFFEGFSGLVNNSYIFGYSVLTIIAGLFIIFLAVVLIKFLKG